MCVLVGKCDVYGVFCADTHLYLTWCIYVWLYMCVPIYSPSPAPSEPQNVAASAVSFSCVDVSWTAPSSAGGGSATITRYHITWSGGSHTVEDATSTSYQVMGLTPETSYSFTVSAENNCNRMSPGAIAMATTGGTELL